MMTTSVVLATYNGERYIIEQLKSILDQTQKVDEVIICDDRSNDRTVSLVNRFIKENNLEESWSIYINEVNKGYINNFLDALLFVTKDIVFYSDQDDIWDKRKVEYMTQVFRDDKAEAVYCLDDTIDSDGKLIHNRLSIINRIPTLKKIKKITLYERLKYGRSPGLCVAFKNSIISDIRHVSMEFGLPHDLPVGLVAAARGKYYLINKVLVHHRVHQKNVSAPETSLLKSSDDLEKQIKSRRIKIKEIQAVLKKFSNEMTAKETHELQSALNTHDLVMDGLQTKTRRKVLLGLINNNRAVNKLLIIRNYISLIGYE